MFPFNFSRGGSTMDNDSNNGLDWPFIIAMAELAGAVLIVIGIGACILNIIQGLAGS